MVTSMLSSSFHICCTATAIFRKAERMLMEQMPIIPIYTYTSRHLIHPSVKGMPANLMDSLNLRYVWLDANWQAPADGEAR
jgi:ABC-type oligopeptide transport system substrate-binding subunit